MKLTGETELLGGKTCPRATLSTTNPTWTTYRITWARQVTYWNPYIYSINL